MMCGKLEVSSMSRRKIKRFLIEFENGMQEEIEADNKRDALEEAIEYTWNYGSIISITKIKYA